MFQSKHIPVSFSVSGSVLTHTTGSCPLFPMSPLGENAEEEDITAKSPDSHQTEKI